MKNQSNADTPKKKQSKTGGVMKKLFHSDNPIMKALTIAADLLILNILTLLLSIPVITMGPAMIAMHEIVIQIVRGEEGYTVQPFFKAFAANFKRGALLSLILAVAGGLLYFDYLAAEAFIPVMKVGIVAIGVIILAMTFYVFALSARYENTLRATLKNAALLAVGNFPKTLFMTVCSVGLWVICIHFYKFGIPILLMFGLSLPCYVNILLLNPVFHQLEGDEPDDEEEEAGSKFWKRFYKKKK